MLSEYDKYHNNKKVAGLISVINELLLTMEATYSEWQNVSQAITNYYTIENAKNQLNYNYKRKEEQQNYSSSPIN